MHQEGDHTARAIVRWRASGRIHHFVMAPPCRSPVQNAASAPGRSGANQVKVTVEDLVELADQLHEAEGLGVPILDDGFGELGERLWVERSEK
jgi:hypothetical protein